MIFRLAKLRYDGYIYSKTYCLFVEIKNKFINYNNQEVNL